MAFIDRPLDRITGKRLASLSDLNDLHDELTQSRHGDSYRVWAFRGQPKTFGSLKPSLIRAFGINRSKATALQVEAELLKAFRSHYGAVYERTRDMPDPDSIGGGHELACLSVMQHYGVPTRLLDWTSDIWTAVYFACAGDPDEDGELWYYDRSIFSRVATSENEAKQCELADSASAPILGKDPDLLSHIAPHRILETDLRSSPRLERQHGHHTVASDVFAEHAIHIHRLANPLPLSRVATDSFQRRVINSSIKDKALTFLEKYKSTTAATIFPDAEGLSLFLRAHLNSLITLLT